MARWAHTSPSSWKQLLRSSLNHPDHFGIRFVWKKQARNLEESVNTILSTHQEDTDQALTSLRSQPATTLPAVPP